MTGRKKGVVRKSGNKPMHNWEEIRKQYIEGIQTNGDPVRYPTIAELSLAWGIDNSYMRNVSAKERWPAQRDAWITRMDESRRERRLQTLARHGAEWDEACLNIARKQLDMINRKIDSLNEPDSRGNIIPCEPKVVLALANALRAVQLVGKIALGESISGDDDRPREIRVIHEEQRSIEPDID